ncbi:MAG: helix-turn-helix domain-containing protein [Lachnospiraceae bacterium]|nr:helix-turn-helix domain-containing protein [Lachnospiraceae bacterium]
MEQTRIACHIGKRTAAYLLQTGLIPCEMTGKKTRCYHVRKEDVIAFILDREKNPDRYIVPHDWTQGNPATKRIRVLPPMPSEAQKRCYYTKKLEAVPDVIDVAAVVEITGYDRHTVCRWIEKGRLKYIMRTNKYYIPKVSLLDYICSDQYERSHRKSRKHIDALWEIHNKNKARKRQKKARTTCKNAR